MRRRYIAIAQIFLFLSIVNLALTAPVVVQVPGVHEMHVNVVDVAEDGAVKSQKRYSLLSLTDNSLSPSPDYFSPSSLLRPRLGDDPNPEVSDHSSSTESPEKPATPPPAAEDPLTSSRLGAGSGAPQSSSSTDNEVDSPRPGTVTKDLLTSSSRLSRPLTLATPESDSEANDFSGPSRDPHPTEPETTEPEPETLPETKDFIGQLSAGPSNSAQSESESESETKESLGRFLRANVLKGKFIRRISGPWAVNSAQESQATRGH